MTKKIFILLILSSLVLSSTINFSIDVNDLEFPNADYQDIVVNGSWNDWGGWGVTLNDLDGDGIFSGEINLNNGTYEYVISATGPADNWSGWGPVINAPVGSSCDWNPDDSWGNYGFVVNNQDLTQEYCAGTCESICDTNGGGGDGNHDPSGEYVLVWSDEFNQNPEIDDSKWNFEIGTGNWGWGNAEHQYYTDRDENAFIEDGKLIIRAIYESYAGSNYTSARMTTKNKGDWLYGKISARIKVPSAGGTWPAFWLMPTNSVYGGWPHSGEIDIMEHYGCNPGHVSSTVHNNMYNWNGGIPPTSYTYNTTATSEFHEYEMEWIEDELKFFVDGTWIGTYYNQNNGWQQWPYDQEFFIILNLAIGSHFMPCETEDDLFPQRYEIDYVRVYQQQECSQTGDLNEDGQINVLDIVYLVDQIINPDNPDNCLDLNSDGLINVVDIVILVNLII